jgi:hypothetical protein
LASSSSAAPCAACSLVILKLGPSQQRSLPVRSATFPKRQTSVRRPAWFTESAPFDDNDDLRFCIDRAIDWAPLVRLTEYDYRAPEAFPHAKEALEFYREILERVGEFAANEVAPHAEAIDREHPALDNGKVTFPPVLQRIMDQVNELQLHAMCLPREFDGMNCPYLLHLVVTELFARADVSVAAHVGLHGGMVLDVNLRALIRVNEALREAARRLCNLSPGGLPEDIAETITFLASPGAAGISGEVLRVCGGSFIGA